MSSDSGRRFSTIEGMSITGDGAREVGPDAASFAGDNTGSDSGAEVSSDISTAVNFKTSPLFCETDSFRGFLSFSSGIA